MPACAAQVQAQAATGRDYAPGMSVTIDRFALSGHEPDLDPIYRLILSAMLHDPRPAPDRLPEATLVLSAYMESFTPSTTPVLPDILNPNQPATGLRGFLQGKAALLNAGGRLVYRGSLLAEIFTGNTVHLVVTLRREGTSGIGTPVRLLGTFTLGRGVQQGSLRTSGPLDRAALAVPAGPKPSWQSVIGQLAVRPPAMMGAPGGASPSTAGSTLGRLSPTSQGAPSTRSTGIRTAHTAGSSPPPKGANGALHVPAAGRAQPPAFLLPAVALLALVLLGLGAFLMRRRYGDAGNTSRYCISRQARSR